MLRNINLKQISEGQWQRRDVLRAGAVSVLGMSPGSSTLAGMIDPQLPGFGRAKRCLVLYIYGAWSQLDTFDPKPLAPVEIRGEFNAIDSCLSGVQVCEHLPLSAQVLDRCTLVRSMSHPWNIHSASYTLTGNPDTAQIEGRQRHPAQWPYLGSAIDYLGERNHFGAADRPEPRNVMLPWRQSLYANPNKRSGTFGGFLGTAYDPLWTEFQGEMPQGDPFREITPQGRLAFGSGDGSQLTQDALERRLALLAKVERRAEHLGQTPAGGAYARQRTAAFKLLATPKVSNALRLEREPTSLREDYGMTLFGQSCLAARRLLEADVKFVTVVWDEYGQTDESWDTHYDHHSRLKDFLLPAFDRAFATLMRDLDERGLLDETLVMCLSEHGRTPKFNATSAGAPGRDHWSRAYSQLFAGAGVPRGKVLGATDGTAADVTSNPTDPKDILCTSSHLLGVDPRTEFQASPGRQVPLVSGGKVVRELLG